MKQRKSMKGTRSFAEQPLIKGERSSFKMPFNVTTAFNAGKLIPLRFIEILPGDHIKGDFESIVRMSTPIFPVMDKAFVDTFAFYVPYRLIWEHYVNFCGQNDSDAWTDSVQYTIPGIKVPEGGWQQDTIADYLGILPGIAASGKTLNALPFRAFAKIWNDWFRDENIQDPCYLPLGDADIQGENGGDATTYVTKVVAGGNCPPVCRYPDVFSKALPAPQKGNTVYLDLGQAPITVESATVPDAEVYDASLVALNQDSSTLDFSIGANAGAAMLTDGTPLQLNGNVNLDNLLSVNSLRQSVALQRFFEAAARGGSRYNEYLANFWNVHANSVYLQRSEFLGGSHTPVLMSSVAQTSSSDTVSPQGNLSAFSVTPGKPLHINKSFLEAGFLFFVGCVRTQRSYQQGLERIWTKRNLFDYFHRPFAHLGEIPVYTRELYWRGAVDLNEDAQIFGYQEYGYDYRYIPNLKTGAMRSGYSGGSLDAWHYADDYSAVPTLTPGWIAEGDANIKRTLAVDSEVLPYVPQFFGNFAFQGSFSRQMPLFSVPGLVDHY